MGSRDGNGRAGTLKRSCSMIIVHLKQERSRVFQGASDQHSKWQATLSAQLPDRVEASAALGDGMHKVVNVQGLYHRLPILKSVLGDGIRVFVNVQGHTPLIAYSKARSWQ